MGLSVAFAEQNHMLGHRVLKKQLFKDKQNNFLKHSSPILKQSVVWMNYVIELGSPKKQQK